MPAALNHSAMSRLSAAAAGDEEAHASTEAVAHLAEDQLVEQAVLDLEADRDRLALALEALDLEADLERLVEDLLLGAALGGLHRVDAAVGLLEDARSGTHEGRLHHGPGCRRSSRRGRRPRRRSRRPSGPTAAPCRTSGPSAASRNCRSSRPRMSCDADRLALVDPRAVAQPHALGATGGAGGVDQGGELVGADRLRRRRDHVGLLGELGRAQRGEVVEGDDPVAVGRARRR